MQAVTIATKGFVTRCIVGQGGGGGAGPTGGYGERDESKIMRPEIRVGKIKMPNEKEILTNETLKITGVKLIIE